MIVRELINKLLNHPMDADVYTQRAYRNNSYVYVKASDVFEEISGKVVVSDLYDKYEFIRLEDENEKLRSENQKLRLELDTHKHPLWSTREAEKVVNELKEENRKLRELLFDPRRVTNEVE